MSGYTITIDAGTTNTRAFLWDGGDHLLAAQKRPVGVRATAEDGDDHRLRQAVRDCLAALLAETGLPWDEIDGVAASGMITSNVGLLELPHLVAPVSPRELAAGAREARIGDVCPLPIVFIPGVKNSGSPVTYENCAAMDMMRGEETETIALLERHEARFGDLIVLPGSHTKYVMVDAQGRIAGCLTSITGELLAAVSEHTVIADAVARGFARQETYDREAMLRGYQAAERHGLGRACFSARILSQLAGEGPQRLQSYVLGACLQSDAAALRGSAAMRQSEAGEALVAGTGPLCRAMADMLGFAGLFARVRTCDPGETPLSGLGALALLRTRREQNG